MSKAGFIRGNKKFAEYANRFWLGAIIVNILRDFYELTIRLRYTYSRSDDYSCQLVRCPMFRRIYEAIPYVKPCFHFGEENADLLLDGVKNICDFFIPLSALDMVRLSPGVTGFLGSVSSVIGIMCCLYPTTRLIPS